MRRIALVLALAAFVISLGGCCWNWCDPMHPRVVPTLDCPAPCDPGCGTGPARGCGGGGTTDGSPGLPMGGYGLGGGNIR